MIKILMLGDVVGAPGRIIFQKYCKQLIKEYNIDAVIVNGENSSSDGRGITPQIMNFFKHNGANVVTSGNHIWAKRDIYNYLNLNKDLLRPANFPSSCPGVGLTTIQVRNHIVGIINLQARSFMNQQVSCPFRAADSLLTYLKTKTNIILIDFHGETTSEKIALATYLDGQISGLVGTHTHVQTADERILPKGTAFISDLGMCGPLNSVIGVKSNIIIQNILTQMPVRYEIETEGPALLSGVYIEIEPATGIAVDIKRIRIIDPNLLMEATTH